MVIQKRPPRLERWLGPPLKNQIGQRSFGDIDSQLKQFAVNPGSAPERIGLRHPANKIADFGTDRRPSRAFATGLKFPEQLETFFMPTHHRLGCEVEAV